MHRTILQLWYCRGLWVHTVPLYESNRKKWQRHYSSITARKENVCNIEPKRSTIWRHTVPVALPIRSHRGSALCNGQSSVYTTKGFYGDLKGFSVTLIWIAHPKNKSLLTDRWGSNSWHPYNHLIKGAMPLGRARWHLYCLSGTVLYIL